MKSHRIAIRCLVLLVVGVVAGWLVGGSGSAGRNEHQPTRPGKSDQKPRAERSAISASDRARVRRVLEAGDLKDRMREIIELANRIPLGEVEGWLDGEFFDVKGGQVEVVFRQILYARLLEADPERLLRRCLRLSHDQTSDFMTQWARTDSAGAEAFLLSLTSLEEKRTIARSVLQELAGRDPSRALELIAQRVSEMGEHPSSFGATLQVLAKTHRSELLEASESWPSSLKTQARNRVTAQWLSEDFAGALQWLADQRDGKAMFSEAGDYNRELGPSLLQNADGLPDGWLSQAIRESGYNLARSAPMAWLQADAEDLGIEQKEMSKVQGYAAGQVGRDPERREEALAMVSNSDLDFQVRRSLLNALLASWNREDAGAAESWLATLQDEQLREAGRGHLDRDRTQSERRRITPEVPSPADLIRTFSQEEGKNQYSQLYQIRTWTARESEEMLLTFRSLPEDERNRAAEAIVERGRSYLDQRIVAEAVSQIVGRPSETPQAQQRLVERASGVANLWGQINPVEAGRWVEGLPPGEIRVWAARNLMNSWTRLSELEARAWAEGLSAEEREFLSDQSGR